MVKILASAACVLLALTYILYLVGFRRLYYNDIRKKHAVNAPRSERVRRRVNDGLLYLDTLKYTEIQTASFDNLKLFGKYYGNSRPEGLAIMLHGYRSIPENDFCCYIEYFVKKGWGVLLPDQRAHRRSGGRTITFGVKERFDVKAWAQYAESRWQVPTVLCGVSMGAASVLMASSFQMPKQVVGVIADCGYTSPEEIIKFVLRKFHVPVGLVYPLGRIGARLFGKFDPESYDALTAMKECKLPVLFIHGEADDFIPCSMSERNYAACASPVKRLVTVPEANHALSVAADSEKVYSAVSEFLDRVIVKT